MKIDPRALSPDGYLIDQRKLDSIPFGGRPSSKNGCGWIAAYNLLRALDRDPDMEEVRRNLEKFLMPGGWLGLNAFVLAAFLRRRGLKLELGLRSAHMQQLAEECRAGIVFYRPGKTNHFAAFRREADGRLRFFGVVAGRAYHYCSMAEFAWRYAKGPLMAVIAVRL